MRHAHQGARRHGVGISLPSFSRVLIALLGDNFDEDYLSLPEDHNLGSENEHSPSPSRRRSSHSRITTQGSTMSAGSGQGFSGGVLHMEGRPKRRQSLSSVTEESGASQEHVDREHAVANPPATFRDRKN